MAKKSPNKKASKKVSVKKTTKATKPTKPAVKKAKTAPTKSAAPAAKKAAPAKLEKKPVAVAPKEIGASSPKAKAPAATSDLKRMILERKSAGPAKAIAFSLDEVREIAKKNEKHSTATNSQRIASAKSAQAKQHAAHEAAPRKPHHVKAASLSDILGFKPGSKPKPALVLDESDVPDKFRRYYRLLVDLRTHVLTQLGEHAEETLLKSAKDDSGDLSGYGQHMADAGTDTFDRDFALSLVSSEQEALAEIEAAIKRIHDGTYGVCESTQKPIAKERLLAVPFTRYSAEAQKEVERHSHRSLQRGGLFGEASEEDGAVLSDGGDDE